MKRHALALFSCLGLVLMLVACNTLQTLNALVVATEAAVPILEAAGVNVPASVSGYVADVASCIAGDSGNPSASQILTISSCLAGKVAPTLPPGIPQAVATIIGQIAQDVAAYLQQHPAPAPGASVATPKLSATDLSHLKNLEDRARVVRNDIRH